MSIITQGIRDLVKKTISENKVIVSMLAARLKIALTKIIRTFFFFQLFSKSYCPYCIRAKDLFDDINVDYKALELNDHKDGEAIQQVLAELTKQKTVPNLFINQQHIGGYDALQAAYSSGKLEKVLKDAGITNAKL